MKYLALLLVLFLVACSTAQTDTMQDEELHVNEDMDDTNEVNQEMPTMESDDDNMADEMIVKDLPEGSEDSEMMDDTMIESDVTITITGENFKFVVDGQDNPTLTVKEGDVVTIDFTSTSGFHDVVIDEFNAATNQVKAGESTSVTFTASKKGTFDYYCSVGSHRANGMVGKIIVE